jgi:hypothetical protein
MALFPQKHSRFRPARRHAQLWLEPLEQRTVPSALQVTGVPQSVAPGGTFTVTVSVHVDAQNGSFVPGGARIFISDVDNFTTVVANGVTLPSAASAPGGALALAFYDQSGFAINGIAPSAVAHGASMDVIDRLEQLYMSSSGPGSNFFPDAVPSGATLTAYGDGHFSYGEASTTSYKVHIADPPFDFPYRTAYVMVVPIDWIGGAPTPVVIPFRIALPSISIKDVPASIITNQTLPQINVAVTSATGTAVAQGTVTLALVDNSTGATLKGTTTRPLSLGVASFTGLSINRPGTYKLQASFDDVTQDSAGFTVDDLLKFNPQPTGGNPNEAIPAFTVKVLDFKHQPETTLDNASIVLTLNHSNRAVATGTTAMIVNGSATFNNVKINQFGESYTFTAVAADAVSATSSSFGVDEQVVFVTQPRLSLAGNAINTAIVVKILHDGRLDTQFTGTVTLTLNDATGGVTGALTGPTQVDITDHSGVATFAGLAVTPGGVGYTLTATTSDNVTGTSKKFTIVQPALTIPESTTAVPVGSSLMYQLGGVWDPDGGPISVYYGAPVLHADGTVTGAHLVTQVSPPAPGETRGGSFTVTPFQSQNGTANLIAIQEHRFYVQTPSITGKIGGTIPVAIHASVYSGTPGQGRELETGGYWFVGELSTATHAANPLLHIASNGALIADNSLLVNNTVVSQLGFVKNNAFGITLEGGGVATANFVMPLPGGGTTSGPITASFNAAQLIASELATVPSQSGTQILSSILGALALSGWGYCSQNLTIKGGLTLDNGALLVNGSLTVDGGVHGVGAIYATGNITIHGTVDLVSGDVASLVTDATLEVDGAKAT